MSRRNVLVGLAVAVSLLLQAGAASAQEAPVVRTDAGAVRGLRGDDAEKFLSIRYAAAPVGSRRWAPPARANRWRGVRPAQRFRARCPQLVSSNGPGSTVEDCLFVNVYRPEGVARDARLPVLFWIHGGGLTNGAADQHDGALLASRNRIVVVAPNYRLGVFGFLALPGLGASAGNFGFLDQQAALRWTRRNAAAFGGDPRRVTVSGESAGGWSVCGHLVSPASRGLFARAIIQSGSCASRSREESDVAGRMFAEAAGCADVATAEACLRAKRARAPCSRRASSSSRA